INGASANLLRSKATNADPWVIGLRQRRPSLVVAVALANKTARIAWAVMHRHENYQRVAAAVLAAGPRSGACERAMTRDGTVGRFRRNRAKPGSSSGHRSRLNDEDSVRGPHQGQQSTRTAPTGRTHDCKRPLRCTPNDLLPGGGHPHMKRREFITLLGGAAAWPLVASAQQQPKMLRVGFVGMQPRDVPHYANFLKRMAELGYQEGRNFTFDYIQTPNVEGYEKNYRELAARKVDVFLAVGNEPALRAALSVADGKPIAFLAVDFDPLAKGYVANLS